MPYRGTASALNFNLINILAESVNRSNALFWLTVWLTAKDRGPWTTDRGYCGRFLINIGFDYRGWGKTFDEHMFRLDRLFPSILDWMVFGENVD